MFRRVGCILRYSGVNESSVSKFRLGRMHQYGSKMPPQKPETAVIALVNYLENVESVGTSISKLSILRVKHGMEPCSSQSIYDIITTQPSERLQILSNVLNF